MHATKRVLSRRRRTSSVCKQKRSSRHRRSVKKLKRQIPRRSRVFLDQGAFIGLVMAATEAYRRESYGVLLGFRRRGMTYIQEAVPYQTAVRKPLSVFIPTSRRKMLEHLWRAMPRPERLGEFHSHVGYGDQAAGSALSREDVEGTCDNDIQVLVAVRPYRAKIPWKHNVDGSISGTVGRYFLKMRAFKTLVTRHESILIRVVWLRCKYAVSTMNRTRLTLARNRRISR